jgi:hypothetical protein
VPHFAYHTRRLVRWAGACRCRRLRYQYAAALFRATAQAQLGRGLAQPVASIGEKGDDERVLEPAIPFADHSYLKLLHHPIERHELPVLAPEAACDMRCDATPSDRTTLVTQITACTSGKLYLYVNDAVLAPPLDPRQFYRNNSGGTTVRVERLYPDGRILPISATPAQPTAPRLLCQYNACDLTSERIAGAIK